MDDKFTVYYGADAGRFAALDTALNSKGYLIEGDAGAAAHSIMEAVTADGYQKVFESHHNGQTTAIEANDFCFECVDMTHLYGIFDEQQFSRDTLKTELRRKKLIK